MLGAFIAQHYASKREAAVADEARREKRRQADVTALQDLRTALVAWYVSMIAVGDPSPGNLAALTDRFPELRVLMLVESVRDRELRDGVYDLMEKSAEVLVTMDAALPPDQGKEALAPVMLEYPSVQRALGEQLRKLQ